MGIFANAIPEFRSQPLTFSDNPAEWLFAALGIEKTDAGIDVNPRNALASTAVYACVNVLAQTVAQVPWDVYRRVGDSKQVDRDRIEHWLLHYEPNGKMSSYSFRVAGMANAGLSGNWFTEIVRDGANRPRLLRLLPWWTVETLEHPTAESNVYRVTRKNGTQDMIDGSDMLHVPCISLDGSSGLSPVQQHKQAIALGLAAEKMGSAFFGNGSRPSGFLKSKTVLKEDQKKQIAEAWKMFQGSGNTGKVPVLGGDIDWQSLSISPDDAQFLETREFQVQDIARIYRVPGVLLGLNDKTNTFASVEQVLLSFVKFTIAPWIQAIEQEYNRKLFPNTDELYCKLDLRGLLRGDAAGRSAFYKSMFEMGAFSPNKILDLEDEDPIEGGDRTYIQQALMPVDKVDDVLDSKKSQPAPPAQPEPPVKSETNSAHVHWLRDVVSRVKQWDSTRRNAKRIAQNLYPVFRSLGGEEVEKFCDSLAEQMLGEIPDGFEESAISSFRGEA